jgi:hypothetical protein
MFRSCALTLPFYRASLICFTNNAHPWYWHACSSSCSNQSTDSKMPLAPILSQMNPIHVIISYLFEIHFEIILSSTPTISKKLHTLHSSPSIIKMIKSRRMRWAGHVARMGRRGMHIEYGWESQKERDYWEDQDVGGCTILRWILER